METLSSNNIEHIMDYLSIIMDNDKYIELLDRYINLISESSSNNQSKINDISKEILNYEIYKKIFDKKNQINLKRLEFFKDKESIDEFIDLNCELITLLKNANDNKHINEFNCLINETFYDIYDSLKMLCFFNDDRLVNYINMCDSEYIKEQFFKLIKNDLTNNKSKMNKNIISYDNIYKCSLNDVKIADYVDDAIEYINNSNDDIKSKQRQINLLKKKRNILKIKLFLLKSLIIPSLVIPLSMQGCGYLIGKKLADENNTISNEEVINEKDYIKNGILIGSITGLGTGTICNIIYNEYFDSKVNDSKEKYERELKKLK